MSDNDDLFGSSSDDGGDTDDLIANAKSAPIATKKGNSDKKNNNSAKKISPKRLQKVKTKSNSIPDADKDSDNDHSLFDSDSDDDDMNDDDNDKQSKKKATPAKKESKPKAKTKELSKRERMEALQAKRRAEQTQSSDKSNSKSSSKSKRDNSLSSPNDNIKNNNNNNNSNIDQDKGYESTTSFNSAEYVRTKEDNDFIDTEDDDPEALRELYAEQHFDNEDEADVSDDEERGTSSKYNKKSSKKRKNTNNPDALSDDEQDLPEGQEPSNPILAAVRRMKKQKKIIPGFSELKDQAMNLIHSMDKAADQDDLAIRQKELATSKLKLLPQVMEIATKREMMRPLLDSDFLIASKRWIEPLPDNSLGNVTLRQRIISIISNMTGEQGIDKDDLKRSDFGKVIMILYNHKKETPEMKKQHRVLIEQWSRSIFKKSDKMSDLESAQSYHRRGDVGLTAFARQVAATSSPYSKSPAAGVQKKQGMLQEDAHQDLSMILTQGVKVSRDLGNNRVQVPYSKGFQYTIRPTNMTGDVTDKRNRTTTVREGRDSLHKRMLEKKRSHSKNRHSANISIEGRPTK